MLSNRLAFAALAIACIGAAAGGGYLATRQNVVPAPASAQVQTAAAVTPAPAPAASPAVAAQRRDPRDSSGDGHVRAAGTGARADEQLAGQRGIAAARAGRDRHAVAHF